MTTRKLNIQVTPYQLELIKVALREYLEEHSEELDQTEMVFLNSFQMETGE